VIKSVSGLKLLFLTVGLRIEEDDLISSPSLSDTFAFGVIYKERGRGGGGKLLFC
jgi:hypothetical protein